MELRPPAVRVRRVACVLVPDFAVAVERLDRPELVGRPVVVGGAPEERKAVLACSAEARARGVRAGVPLRDALARCPEAALLEAHPARYAAVAATLNHALAQLSPLVEPADPGETYVGLDGLEALHGSEEQLGARIADWGLQMSRVPADLIPRPPSGVLSDPEAWENQSASDEGTPFPPREGGRGVRSSIRLQVGIADGKFVARVAALLAAPERVRRVPPGAAPGFLAALPVSVLPVAPEIIERLGLFGLRRLGDLAGLPLAAVQAQFGPEGRRAWRLARGLDDTPLLPQDFPLSLEDRFSFDPPVATSDVVTLAARHLLGRLVEHPLFHFRAARGLTFRAHTSDGQTWERRLTFRQPLSDPERMLLALRGKLAAFAPSAPVEAVTLALSDLCAEAGAQASLPITQRVGDREQLREAIHQLRSHYGYSPIAKIVEVEPWSRIPERRRALIDYDP